MVSRALGSRTYLIVKAMALATCHKCSAMVAPAASSFDICQATQLQSLIHMPLCGRFRVSSPRKRASCSVQSVWWGVKKPEKVELEPITTEAQFDQVLSDCQESDKGVVIVWMALWCRKCIYLKPKLEKLGAEFYPNFQFYCVDVNSLPKALIDRAEVKKMPTIQYWRNGMKKADVIGGHQAWQVLDEVREMLNKKD